MAGLSWENEQSAGAREDGEERTRQLLEDGLADVLHDLDADLALLRLGDLHCAGQEPGSARRPAAMRWSRT